MFGDEHFHMRQMLLQARQCLLRKAYDRLIVARSCVGPEECNRLQMCLDLHIEIKRVKIFSLCGLQLIQHFLVLGRKDDWRRQWLAIFLQDSLQLLTSFLMIGDDHFCRILDVGGRRILQSQLAGLYFKLVGA